MRSIVKHGIQRGLRAVHGLWLDRGLPRKIGVYGHALEPAWYGALEEMVDYFRSEGYRFADPDGFLADPDEPAVFLSFDDCYRAWHEALPLFLRLDVPVTFYVNTGCFRDRAAPAEVEAYFDRLEYFGERVTLSTAELRELDAAGCVIGAHTHTHRCLTALPPEEARAEIRRSKEELEALLGRPVRHFSYPFGMRRHFSDDLRAYCRSLGLATVANAIPGLQHAGQSALALQRSPWWWERPLAFNLANVSVDGRVFERLTGRSAVG